MSWDDPMVIVAVYAAVVSSIGMIWNIIRSIRQSITKLKVEAVFHQVFVGIPAFGYTSPASPKLTAKITNTGKVDRSINNPGIQFSSTLTLMGLKSKTLESHSVNGNVVNFPVRLVAGDVFEKSMDIPSLYSKIQDQVDDNTKFRIVVCDTLGKKCYSKWHKVKMLREQVELSQGLNA